MIVLPAQVKHTQSIYNGSIVTKVWDPLQELSPDDDIIEADAHASACQRVPHVVGVSENQDSRPLEGIGREEAVRHAPHTPVDHTVSE